MYERKNLGIWLMYLRKSRQDNPNETVEEVLAKHEIQLQEYALRERGVRIQEENIYREVVSGETIEAREEIKKVLARIEDSAVTGVLVIEPQRLSRGDLLDCGHLINAFRFTHTQVITPVASYDLGNKMERKFFQDELLRGRDYLEYTKEIMTRGKIAAVKRGCYLGNIPPYGYDKIKIGKDSTLVPNENADIVRTIFDLSAQEGLAPYSIAKQLNEQGIPSANGCEWGRDTIRKILTNHHYIGKVVFNHSKCTPVLENGKIVRKRLQQELEEIIIADGKHPAIIEQDVWDIVQKRFARDAPVQHGHPLKNPLSGVLFCKKCGRAMYFHPMPHADARMECRTVPRCYRTVKVSALVDAVVFALEFSELPELELKLKNTDGPAKKTMQQDLLNKLEKQMEDYRDQEDKQFDLLEMGKYTPEIFEHRHTMLREKMEICQRQIYEAKQEIEKIVDYSERVATLKNTIAILKDPNATPVEQNNIVKSIVSRIEFTGQQSLGSDRKGIIPNENNFSVEITLSE